MQTTLRNSLIMAQIQKLEVSKKQVHNYVFKTLTKPRKKLGGMSICPFINHYADGIQIARHQDLVVFAQHYADIKDILKLKAVVVYGFYYSYEKMEKIVSLINKKYAKQDMVALMMHPDGDESVLPVEYAFHVPLLIIQSKKLLNDTKCQLKKSKYYKYYK